MKKDNVVRVPLPSSGYLHEHLTYWDGYLFAKKSRRGIKKGQMLGTTTHGGRIGLVLQGYRYYAHRVIWKMHHGTEPQHIDHINGDATDNRIENLAEVTHTENMRNCKRNAANKHGVMGIHWNKQQRKWQAIIGAGGGRNRHLGYFDDFNDAVVARRSAEVELGYSENHGRVAS